MAKGDATGGASGIGGMQGAAAPNNKMDQYSVMHHLMQQLGGGQQSGGFGSAIGSMAPSIGALMGGMQKPQFSQAPVYGAELQQAMGQGQPYDQQVQGQQAQNQMQQFGNQMGYGQQRNQQMPQMSSGYGQQMPRQMFNRFGNGPMMNSIGMQGSLAPQNRFRQQLNQQPASETNQQV